MAAQEHSRSPRPAPDRFHVGQACTMVLCEQTGFRERNGAPVIVTAARRYGRWHCNEPGSPRPAEWQTGWRYEVQGVWGRWNVEETMLRAVYEDEALASWETFAQLTGWRPDREAMPVARRRVASIPRRGR